MNLNKYHLGAPISEPNRENFETEQAFEDYKKVYRLLKGNEEWGRNLEKYPETDGYRIYDREKDDPNTFPEPLFEWKCWSNEQPDPDKPFWFRYDILNKQVSTSNFDFQLLDSEVDGSPMNASLNHPPPPNKIFWIYKSEYERLSNLRAFYEKRYNDYRLIDFDMAEDHYHNDKTGVNVIFYKNGRVNIYNGTYGEVYDLQVDYCPLSLFDELLKIK